MAVTLMWQAIGRNGNFATAELSARSNQVYDLFSAGYNREKVWPELLIVRNDQNNAPILITFPNRQQLSVPAYSQLRIDIKNRSSIEVSNRGFKSCQLIFADKNGAAQSDISLSFTEAGENVNDLLLHFNTALDANSGMDWGFEFTNSAGCTLQGGTAAKFGRQAMNLSGTSDYLRVRNNSFFECAKNFTLDFWADPTVLTAGNKLVCIGSTGQVHIAIGGNSGSNYKLDLVIDGVTYPGGGYVISTSGYYHIALTRDDGLWRVFVNGVLDQAVTDDYAAALDYLIIGQDTGGGAGHAVRGNYDEVRYTKSYAAYTSNFSAPLAPY